MIKLLGKELTEQQEQQFKIGVILLLTGVGFYFLVYLPAEEIRKLEITIQGDIEKTKTIQPQDYNGHLMKLQSYLKWKDEGSELQQEALNNQEEELKKAIDWLVKSEKNLADANAQARTREEADKKRRELENIKKKKLHWRRQREKRSWTESWLARKKDSFENTLRDLGGEENINIFDVAADYNIHFPPSLWKELTNEQKKSAESNGHGELELDEKTKSFRWNSTIEDWYDKVTYNPVRGEQDPVTEKDNNALFYGTGGTGKTSIVRKLAYYADSYPLIEIKGSNLTPRKEDYENGIDPLNKFIFTLCDIENNLEDNYNFARELNDEIRYILFVDEADNVCSNTALPTEYTKLIFLKACMEGIKKDAQSQNLWIFATNYLHLIDPPVYRPGRLSNPLDFSWTLGDFKKEAERVNIINQFPLHWQETNTLNEEDNKWVNRFNAMNFKDEFLPFWRKFINHSETQKQLVEVKKEHATKENPTQPGIKIGEMLEFFWNLFDSKQLPHFYGKYEKPKKPTTEELIPTITEVLDIRLKELTEQVTRVNEELNLQKQQYVGELNHNISKLQITLGEICKKIE